eukprot:CAMPEP_0114542310 /NCGR_PEP_ID=MMETSP0114-20121206/1771_1 /TAXON_ID=31324 /ORGANISM="Goniomonas sp, Strain m" /LENGTH=137 /DNA_ID=CAMNT_0001726607 /DNA_START=121 /DNA_END=534 /DNA_ORIENTATION=-
MQAGVAIDDACVNSFNNLKLKKDARYIIFKMDDDLTKVVVDSTGAPATPYADFLAQLPANECRYAAYDYAYQHQGCERNKIVFIAWAPDSSKIKQKMVYATTKEELKKRLVGIGAELQCTDKSEAAEAAILAKCQAV